MAHQTQGVRDIRWRRPTSLADGRSVKKPYNPVLGEFFRCSYFYDDGSEGYYIAEQVSHHPVSCNGSGDCRCGVVLTEQPVSAFCYISPRNGILVTGELKPKSKFLGNSAATIMEGEDRIRLLGRPEDGDYHISVSSREFDARSAR